jgi:hypothetical protein
VSRYGPHEPANEPTEVIVYGPEKWPAKRTEEVPDRIRRQRAQVNAIARGDTPPPIVAKRPDSTRRRKR